MRILHVITSLRTGGAEKLIVDLLPRFKEMGIDVDLLLFDGSKTPFYDKLKGNGIKIMSLQIGGNVYNPINIFRLKKYLKNYDTIHTHNTACQYYVAIASKLFKCKTNLITTEHSTYNRRRDIWGFRNIDKYIYKRYNHIISISQKANDNLINFIGNNYPTTIIQNGIELSKYNATINIPNTNNDIIITMVAGFRPEKDQDTLIKAINRLPNNYMLWLIGDGERRNEIETLISQLHLSDRVKLWGIRNDIPNILAKSHIVVLSSHWEGFGLSILEGMASTKPVIASDVDGLREVVAEAGILFPLKDYKTLAIEIKSLCENPAKYQQLAIACQKRANKFDINITIKEYINLYNKIYSKT